MDRGTVKQITDLLVFCQIHLRYMKGLCTNKCQFFFDEILSQYECGFRKGFSLQHRLASMLKKWCEAIDNGAVLGHF